MNSNQDRVKPVAAAWSTEKTDADQLGAGDCSSDSAGSMFHAPSIYSGLWATWNGMAKFPSNEWVQEYVKKLNCSQGYKDAGKTWEGDIMFIIEKDDAFSNSAYVYLDLYHGECRRALYADSIDQVPKAAYAYRGPYSNWRKLIEGQIDPIQGLLAGKFRLDDADGNELMEMLNVPQLIEMRKYIRAAKEMVSAATTVPTEF